MPEDEKRLLDLVRQLRKAKRFKRPLTVAGLEVNHDAFIQDYTIDPGKSADYVKVRLKITLPHARD